MKIMDYLKSQLLCSILVDTSFYKYARNSICWITYQMQTYNMDGVPMIHKYCFKDLDRTLRDFILAFGGKTIIYGGDFRYISFVIYPEEVDKKWWMQVVSVFLYLEGCAVLKLM